MTPKKKTAHSTSLSMERKRMGVDRKTSLHVAGGEHKGIVINKEVEEGEEEVPAHLCLEFRVFLVNVSSGKHAQEKRLLSFWFKQEMLGAERPRYAQQFFKQLVSPLEFPRGQTTERHPRPIIVFFSDYVGFIKKIMKLMQNSFPHFRKIEVELTKEQELEKIPEGPSEYFHVNL